MHCPLIDSEAAVDRMLAYDHSRHITVAWQAGEFFERSYSQAMNINFEKILTASKPYLYLAAIFVCVYACGIIFLNFMEKRCLEDCFSKGGMSYTFALPDVGKYSPKAACKCIKVNDADSTQK